MIFTEEDRLRELRLAQKDIYNAGNDLVSAGLRLQGTKYEQTVLLHWRPARSHHQERRLGRAGRGERHHLHLLLHR